MRYFRNSVLYFVQNIICFGQNEKIDDFIEIAPFAAEALNSTNFVKMDRYDFTESIDNFSTIFDEIQVELKQRSHFSKLSKLANPNFVAFET
eukprot:UN07950